MPTEREWMDVRERLRYEVEHPNTRVNQIHRNEWPKLWAVIDEIVSDDFVLGPDEEEDLPIPEIPMAADFDEDDELVAMEALPDIPEPGAGATEEDIGRYEAHGEKDFDATTYPIPPDEVFDLDDDGHQ